MRRRLALPAAALMAGALALTGGPAVAATAATSGPAASFTTTSTAMRALAAHLTRHPAARTAALAAGPAVVEVHLDDWAQAAVVERSIVAAGGTIRHELPRLDIVSASMPTASPTALRADLPANLDLTTATAHKRVLAADYTPNDPDYLKQESYLDAAGVPAAWSADTGSASVKLAVIDSGVDVAHEDLASKVVGQYNAVDGSTDVTDDAGHGTFVAGVAAAATDNSTGVSGVGFTTSLLAVKVADSSGAIYTDAEAAGIEWAINNGANVINLSLGSDSSDATEKSAIDDAIAHGITVVASAGNCGDQYYTENGCQTQNPVVYPAAYPGVISVGATNGDTPATAASFSETGSWVTVGAPGVHIYSTLPTSETNSALYDFTTTSYGGGNDTDGDGTSFASPIVAGEAALLLAENSALTPAQVKKVITTSADPSPSQMGAGEVNVAAAINDLPPTTTPTAVTAIPSEGSVALSATSTAPLVQFLVDGHPAGSPVAVDSGTGTASTAWSSYGQANGTHQVTAEDCSPAACGSPTDQVPADVENTAPSITSPKAGQTVGGSIPVTASVAAGTPGVAFLVDGTRFAFDGTAPYTATLTATALPDGTHVLTTVSCNVTGTSCSGPVSAAVSITVKELHPAVTAATSPISPNGDKHADTSTVTFSLPDTETVTWEIVTSTGAAESSIHGLGTLAKGIHTFSWNGLSRSGSRAADGTYQAVVMTTAPGGGGTTLHGRAQRPVVVDDTAPTLTSLTGSGATVYPVRDGYRDTFSPAVTINEPATLTLTITNSAGSTMKTISAYRAAGHWPFTWTGTNSSGALVPAGSYRFRWKAVDRAFNPRTSSTYSFAVSLKKLTAKTAYVYANGDAGSFNSTDTCGDEDATLSSYPSGDWFDMNCDYADWGAEVAGDEFVLAVPAAAKYTSITLQSYGYTLEAPMDLAGAFSTASGAYDAATTGDATIGGNPSWVTVATGSGADVSSTHHVDVLVALTNADGTGDYDLGQIRLYVRYSVLQ